MLVYCEMRDCKHNDDGECENVWPCGTMAIRICESLDYIGMPVCDDYEVQEDEN